MNIIITSGGTAGHINPSLALGDELKQRGHNVCFAGTPNRLESKLVPEAGFEFKAFEAKGFNRKKPYSIFSALLSIVKSTNLAKEWLIEKKADCVVGFGSYVSLSICRAAKKIGIPYVIHEQNSVMGMANKYLSKNANTLCLTYERANNNKCKNVIVTGNPVRSQIIKSSKEDGRKMLDIPMDAKMLLVFGGSLGAKKINDSITKIADMLLDRKDLYIVHITGDKQYDDVVDNLFLKSDKLSRYKTIKYESKMGLVMAAADFCISRAGASTLAELTALKLPALLVPYPYATENHQYYNAQTLLDEGCALYIDDKDVGTEKFNDMVTSLIDDGKKLNNMQESYNKFDAENAVKKLADIVESST